MIKKQTFTYDQIGSTHVIVNSTDYDIEISLVPIKPKRKEMLIKHIASGWNYTFDCREFDLSTLCVRLKKGKGHE